MKILNFKGLNFDCDHLKYHPKAFYFTTDKTNDYLFLILM